ncbi:hypothetical protein HN014_15015 [Aquimarina sp. TRL1]|uniref:hypothetical protein n=1 Tax=Aquimarina sp. (strain TRL1) TaxID=2736252 RepID=UPI0015891BF6|nr:hypothetical protein [Aquimarina sp. TRL1]QKX06165.1 hypothetical protein HN014_15015 [Aquimarina sp. TRL1]
MNKTILILLSIVIASCGSPKKNINNDSEAFKLIWDFSNNNTYVYSLKATVSSEFKKSENSPLLKSAIVEKSTITVQAKPNQLADFSIKDLQLQYKWFKEDGTLNDSSSLTIPTKTIADITPNGNFGESDADMYFKLLMPLPASNIQRGESYKIPLKLPLEEDPSLYNEGFNTITFTKIRTIQGRKCAILKGLLDISTLKLTKDLEGHYTQKITGISTYYFDLEKRCFIGSDISMTENSSNDLSVKSSESSGFYTMSSNKVIKIRLDGIGDSLE